MTFTGGFHRGGIRCLAAPRLDEPASRQSSSGTAYAVVCGAGPYRAGCAGPNGAVDVHHPYSGYCDHPYRPYETHRAAGPYRAGCVGPNGGVVGAPPSQSSFTAAPTRWISPTSCCSRDQISRWAAGDQCRPWRTRARSVTREPYQSLPRDDGRPPRVRPAAAVPANEGFGPG